MKNNLEWYWVDDGWEAQSSACYEPGDHMTWRFYKLGEHWVDSSSYELKIDDVIKAQFNSPEEAKWQYQAWENEMIEAFTNDYQENYK